jgi:hypothetical protein
MLQKTLAASNSRVKEAMTLSAEAEELEGAVCRAAQRVAALKEALSGDEAALTARLAVQASRLKVSTTQQITAVSLGGAETAEHMTVQSAHARKG